LFKANDDKAKVCMSFVGNPGVDRLWECKESEFYPDEKFVPECFLTPQL